MKTVFDNLLLLFLFAHDKEFPLPDQQSYVPFTLCRSALLRPPRNPLRRAQLHRPPSCIGNFPCLEMDDSPVSDISRPNATRAWTDAEYFRLLSHELPVEERDPSQLCGNLGECEDVRVPSPMSKASSRLAGDGDYLDPLGSRTASCSSSRCNSTRTSCSSTVSASYACGNRACQVPSSKWELVVGTDEQPIHGVAYEALEDRWVAFWRRSGDIHTACFSCDTYGYHRARQMAVQCRQKAEALGLTADEDKPRRASPCDPPPAVQANSRAQNASSACKHIAADQALSRAQLRQKRLHEAASAARADSDRLNSLPKVTGVRFQAQRNRFVAEWYDQGKTRMAYFPVKQYGFEEARKMAIECRKVCRPHAVECGCSRAGMLPAHIKLFGHVKLGVLVLGTVPSSHHLLLRRAVPESCLCTQRVLVSKNQRLSCINKAGVSTRREADPPITDTKSSARRASSPPSHEVSSGTRQCTFLPAEVDVCRSIKPSVHLAFPKLHSWCLA